MCWGPWTKCVHCCSLAQLGHPLRGAGRPSLGCYRLCFLLWQQLSAESLLGEGPGGAMRASTLFAPRREVFFVFSQPSGRRCSALPTPPSLSHHSMASSPRAGTEVDTEAPKCASCPAAASNSCVPKTELRLALRAAADHSLPPTPKVYPLLVLAGFLLHSCLGVRGLGHPRQGRLSSQALQPDAYQQPWRSACHLGEVFLALSTRPLGL